MNYYEKIKNELIKRGLNWDRRSKKPLEEKQIAMRVSSEKNLSEFSITLGLNE